METGDQPNAIKNLLYKKFPRSSREKVHQVDFSVHKIKVALENYITPKLPKTETEIPGNTLNHASGYLHFNLLRTLVNQDLMLLLLCSYFEGWAEKTCI